MPLFLAVVAGFSLLVAVGIAAMPASIEEPRQVESSDATSAAIPWQGRSFLILAVLFFLYVGTENAVGGWSASYATSLGSMSATMATLIPSFFYSALMLGRWLAPFLLARLADVRVAQGGLLLACTGMAGLVGSHSALAVTLSASAAGLGLAAVYPITISFLPREFGSDASRIGSIMFTCANLGGSFVPWLVGVLSSRLSTLKAGLAIPLITGAVMLVLYQRRWEPEPIDQTA